MTFQNYTGRSTSRPCNVTVHPNVQIGWRLTSSIPGDHNWANPEEPAWVQKCVSFVSWIQDKSYLVRKLILKTYWTNSTQTILKVDPVVELTPTIGKSNSIHTEIKLVFATFLKIKWTSEAKLCQAQYCLVHLGWVHLLIGLCLFLSFLIVDI